MKLATATTAILALAVALADSASAQRPDRDRGRRDGRPKMLVIDPVEGERVAWFSTLESGLAEARRTQKPIFLISARPNCRNVPGAW
jgi:hypothetical protein